MTNIAPAKLSTFWSYNESMKEKITHRPLFISTCPSYFFHFTNFQMLVPATYKNMFQDIRCKIFMQ